MKLFNYSVPAESINFDAECIPGYDSKSKNLIYRTRNVQGTNDFFLPSFEPFSDDLDRAIDLNVATFPTKLFDRNRGAKRAPQLLFQFVESVRWKDGFVDLDLRA